MAQVWGKDGHVLYGNLINHHMYGTGYASFTFAEDYGVLYLNNYDIDR